MKLRLLALAITSANAFATEQAAANNDKSESMETVIITASRIEQNVLDVPASVEVIDDKQILETSAYFITDVLKKNASVDIIEYPGGLSGVGLRGFRPQFSGINQRVLVLVDGRPSGATSMGNIANAGLERVEVVKGSASAIYGPSAMGGVVNYITRKSTGDISGDLSVGYGSYESSLLGVNVGGSVSERFNFDLGVVRREQNEDFKLGSGGERFGDFQQGNGAERPNTTYERTNIFARAAYEFADGWEAQLRLLGLDAPETDTPGAESDGTSDQGGSDVRNFGGDFGVNGHIGDHKIMVLYYSSEEESESLRKPEDASPYVSFARDTSFEGFQLQDNWKINDHYDLVLGADYSIIESQSASFNADGSSRAPFSPYSEQSRYGVFTDMTARWLDGRVIFNAGVRYDGIKNEVLATPLRDDLRPSSEDLSTVNPRAGVVLRPQADSPFRIHASAGTGYIVPEANQLAGYSERVVGGQTRITEGNPDLDPESSESYDLGVGYDGEHVGVDLTYFLLDTDDRITSVTTTNTDGSIRFTNYENSLSSSAAGWELTAQWDIGQWFNADTGVWTGDLSSTYYTKREEDLRSGDTGTIRNVARFKINLGVAYDDGTYNVRLSGRHVRGMEDLDFSSDGIFAGNRGGTYEYPSFTVFDLSTGWNIDDANRLSLKIDNLTDEYYFEKGDFPLPGRAFHAEYKYSF